MSSPPERLARQIKTWMGWGEHGPATHRLRSAYERWLRGLYGHCGLPRQYPGAPVLRLDPAYRALAEGLEPHVQTALRQTCRDLAVRTARGLPRLSQAGPLAFDVGANVGVYAMLMAHWLGPTGRVIAFEPAPPARAALVAHTRLNRLANRIDLVEAAVGRRAGTATLHLTGAAGINTLVPQTAQRLGLAQTVAVPVVTLDELCRAEALTPGLIKIDVEGFEADVLAGATATVRTHRPIILMEIHATDWPDPAATAAEIRAWLADVGYNLVPLSGQADALAVFGHALLRPAVS